MAWKPAFQRFLQEFQIETRKPSSEAALRKAEAELGFPILEPTRSCYLTCDGGQAKTGPEGPRSSVELLSLEAAVEYAQVRGPFNACWGYLPLVENNDSNPVCLCCQSVLTGYVVLVRHDDSPRLMFRSAESFFRASVEYIKDGEFFDTLELPSEFDGPDRTKKDISIARQLIGIVAAGYTRNDEERTDALRFASDLLSDEHVEEIAALLKDEHEYVRRHVAKRLKRISGAKGREALSKFESDFDAFVECCARKLQREGIRASVQAPYGRSTIRIDPGPVWLNMEMFYSERKREDLEDYLLERARFFLKQKKKKDKKQGG